MIVCVCYSCTNTDRIKEAVISGLHIGHSCIICYNIYRSFCKAVYQQYCCCNVGQMVVLLLQCGTDGSAVAAA